MPVKPFISIVVPALNEEFSLPATLRALQSQNYSGRFEIIVVNNASTDNTAAIADDLGCKVVDQPHKGYVYALMAGFGAAKGDIIAVTDADTIVPPDWLTQIDANLSRPGVAACSGTFVFSDGSAWIRFLGWAFGRLNYHLAGANMAVWRDAFNRAGGLMPTINMGADIELGLRLKKVGKVVIDRKLVVATSARRFQVAFWRTLVQYYCNDLALLLFHKAIFYGFPNYRAGTRLAVGRPLLRIAFPLVIVFFFFLIAWYQTALRSGSVFAHGGNVPLVALTFDDGPSTYTEQILDVLKQHNIKATFFLIGKNIEHNPALARRIVAEGHAIGNHTYSHPFLTAIQTRRQVAGEIDRAESCIEQVTGGKTDLFRPPHGWETPLMQQVDANKHYTVVTWDVDPKDWQHIPAAAIVKNTVQKTRPGSIVLLHDGLELNKNPHMENTVNALPEIIEDLENRGYRFVTVPQLIESTKEAQAMLPAYCAGSRSTDSVKPQ